MPRRPPFWKSYWCPKSRLLFSLEILYVSEMSPLSIFLVLPFVSLEYFALVSSISFTLPPGQEKCLREEVHKDVLVTGEYKLSDAPHMKTHLTVGLKTVEISALHMASIYEPVVLLFLNYFRRLISCIMCMVDRCLRVFMNVRSPLFFVGEWFNWTCLIQERRCKQGEICFYNGRLWYV